MGDLLNFFLLFCLICTFILLRFNDFVMLDFTIYTSTSFIIKFFYFNLIATINTPYLQWERGGE